MDFNILIPSIAKTLKMASKTTEDISRLSHKLMNVLAEYNHVIKSLKILRDEYAELSDNYDEKCKKLKVTEELLVGLTVNKKISKIVTAKIKKVFADHDVKIVNQKIKYPPKVFK